MTEPHFGAAGGAARPCELGDLMVHHMAVDLRPGNGRTVPVIVEVLLPDVWSELESFEDVEGVLEGIEMDDPEMGAAQHQGVRSFFRWRLDGVHPDHRSVRRLVGVVASTQNIAVVGAIDVEVLVLGSGHDLVQHLVRSADAVDTQPGRSATVRYNCDDDTLRGRLRIDDRSIRGHHLVELFEYVLCPALDCAVVVRGATPTAQVPGLVALIEASAASVRLP